jgi:tRNA C32,U32 (ribose-2'-O)-methylase TrmJ
LASDNVGEATVPATVEIPAGAAAATFPVATVADGATDGAKTVHIMASAAGHESSTASLTVTDSDVADLVVAWVESPGVVETESITSARYRVENRGNVAATGPFIVRLYTSVDAVAGGDTYAAQYTFPGNLPAGGHFEINQSFTVPRRVGPLYLVAEVDPVRAVTELAEDNNTAVSAAVMDVRAAYTAVAYTDVSVAMATSSKLAEATAAPWLSVERASLLLPPAGERLALVFGNERTGLSVDEAALCPRVVRLPTPGPTESLNLSHAVAVTLTLFAAAGAEEPRAAQASRQALKALLTEQLDARGFFKGGVRAREGFQPRLQELLDKMDLTERDLELLKDLVLVLSGAR